jgi:hypothetical protein
VNSRHNISKEKYVQKFGPIQAMNFSKRRSEIGKINGNWIERKKVAGEDLSEYKVKMGAAVKESIMSNPEERKRRSEQMAMNNRTSEAREKSRVTAKKTSARPEIMKARGERLEKWRNDNFDEFYEKCTKVMQSTWSSKPEKMLFNIVSDFNESFNRNQRLYDSLFSSKSHRKQIDIMSHELNILIEFDGRVHFEPIYNDQVLRDAQTRDRELDNVILKHGWTLIRISYDQFSYKGGGKFSDDCLKQLFDHLQDPKPGVHHIGEAYKLCSHPVPETFIACSEDGNYCGESSMSCVPPVQQRSISCT